MSPHVTSLNADSDFHRMLLLVCIEVLSTRSDKWCVQKLFDPDLIIILTSSPGSSPRHEGVK